MFKGKIKDSNTSALNLNSDVGTEKFGAGKVSLARNMIRIGNYFWMIFF